MPQSNSAPYLIAHILKYEHHKPEAYGIPGQGIIKYRGQSGLAIGVSSAYQMPQRDRLGLYRSLDSIVKQEKRITYKASPLENHVKSGYKNNQLYH